MVCLGGCEGLKKITYWRTAPIVKPGGNEVGRSFRECTTRSTLELEEEKQLIIIDCDKRSQV